MRDRIETPDGRSKDLKASIESLKVGGSMATTGRHKGADARKDKEREKCQCQAC